jgi:NAD(P)-dependent dehydrogenase (short-subunit alcohol dehydrogenase family)
MRQLNNGQGDDVGRLNGKVAIVVGSATGIGAATAKLMAKEGAKVIASDINLEGAIAVASEIRSSGGDATALFVDIADEGTVKEMIAQTVSAYGGIDVLHNNAAAMQQDVLGRDRAADVLTLDLEVWEKTITIDLRGYLFTSRHAVPLMLQRGRGSIINMTSSAAERALPVVGAYSVAKAGVIALTRSIARAYGKRGIRCNAIAPSARRTGAAAADSATGPSYYTRELLAARGERIMTPRHGIAEDIAPAVVFLASDESEMVQGQVIHVDGGSSYYAPWP